MNTFYSQFYFFFMINLVCFELLIIKQFLKIINQFIFILIEIYFYLIIRNII